MSRQVVWDRLVENLNYAAAMVLFGIGFYTVIMRRNVIKKIIGLNIMETSVFLLLVSIGYLNDGIAPIAVEGADPSRMVNPIPQALILTGIVVAVSTTALALALVLKLYRHYGTLNVDELGEGGQ
jgi:multicomponent Na+:H+ antiporter subunit C